jgi:hypothetical protein
MNEDGDGLTRLTEDNTQDQSPSWSPDGTKIAFSRFDSDIRIRDIYVMNPDGSGITRLTEDDIVKLRPDWGTNTSPAGGGDRTPPTTVIDSAVDSDGNSIGNNTSTTSNSITFEFSSPDSDVSEFQCSLDNAEWQDCTSPVSYSGLAEGEHTFSVKAIDASGNEDPGPPVYVWTVVVEEEPTPAEAIEELILEVEGLEDVSQSTKNSLTAPLRQAVDLLSDDNPNNDESACGRLDAFLNQVDAAERRGDITEQQATDLRTQATDIRTELGC